MAVKTPTVRVAIDPYIVDASKEIKEYEKKLKNLQKQAEDMGFGDDVLKDIQKCIDKINEYNQEIKRLSDQKLSTDAFDKFTKEVDSRLEEVSENMNQLEEKISSLSKTMENINGEKMSQQLDRIKRSFSEFRHDTKEAIQVLKDFQELLKIKANDKELSQLSRTIEKISNIDLLNLDGVKATKKQLGSLQNELADTYQTYKELQDTINDPDSSPTVLKNAEDRIATLIPKMSELIKKVAQANKLNKIDLEQFATGFTFDSKTFGTMDFDKILIDIDNGTEDIKKRLLTRATEIQDESKILKGAVTTATSFQFEDGGIHIPVILDKDTMQNCRAQLQDLISELTKISENNPVDVTLRLFPLKADKSEQAEVSDYIKNIRAQIPELPEGELKDSVSNFMDQFEKEYQKALILKIKVALSDDVESVEKKIKELKQVVKKTKLEINPSFRITEEEETKLKNKINKVKKDFSFDVASELTKMSDSLTTLLSSTNPSAWTDAFATGLSEVRGKLLAMQSLINPLLDLMNEKPANGTGTAGRPSDETIANRSYVEKFTIAVDTLNKALKAYNKTKSSTKADDFVGDVQKSVDESGAIIKVPVEPIVSGFVEKIQNAIGDVPLDITVNGITGTGEGGSVVASGDTKPTKSKSGGKGKTTTASTNTDDTTTPDTAQKTQEKKVSDYEQRLTKSFNGLYNAVVDSIKHLQQGIGDSKKWESIIRANQNALPELQEITDISKIPSETTREELLTKYLKRKGVDREGKKSLTAQEEELRNLINAKGRKSNKDYENIIKKFVDYEDDGGKLSLKYLASDKSEKMQERLTDKYNKLASSIREKNQAEQESVASSNKVSQETEKQTQKVDKNTQAKKENKQETEQVSEKSKKLAEEALTKAKAVNKESSAIEENTETKQENNKAEEGFEQLRKTATSLGNFDQRIKGNKENLTMFVDQYKKYLEMEGNTGRPITDLTDNVSAQKKLQDAYEKSTTAVKENTEEKKKNNTVTEQTPKTAEELAKEALAYAKANSEIKENTEVKKENNEATEKASKSAEDTLTDDQLAELYGFNVGNQQTTEKKTKNKKQGLTTKDKIMSKIAGLQNKGELDLTGVSDSVVDKIVSELEMAVDQGRANIKEVVENFKQQIENYKANQNVAEPSFTDTESDSNQNEYIDSLLNKTKLTKEEVAELINELYRLEKVNESLDVDSDELFDNTIKQTEIGAVISGHFNDIPDNPLDHTNPEYQAKIFAENYGEEYTNALKAQIPNIKNAGYEAGTAGAEGAKEGTQEAQKSNSPSLVAKALGGDWGKGYANGILKSDAEVRAAVRQLVSSGTMTAQEIINDIPNIMSDSKYKDLVTPVTDYKSTYKSAITQVKGSITKLNNADDLSPEQLDKFDANFTKWSTKLKELGVDITKFQNDYSSARAKFGSSIEESLGAVKNEISEEKLTMDEYLQLIKEIGKNYLGDEVVNMIEQTRVKDLKNGSTFTARSYKVTGQSGSVTLDPNGRVIANRATISDDYTQTQKWNAELLKQRDTYLTEILAKEKAIAIEQNKGNTNTTAELERQRDAAQKLYDLTTKDLEAFAEQSVIEEQNTKHAEARRKTENEINTIIAQQLDALDKQAQKEQEIAEKQKQKEDEAYGKSLGDEADARQRYWEKFAKEQADYEKSQADNTYEKQATAAYNELTSKVDEYVKMRKRIAQGKPFENDIKDVDKLSDEIIDLADKMEHQFGEKLADKATSGLSGLEEKISEIEQTVAQKEQEKITKTFSGLKGKIDSSIYDVGFEIDHGNHTQEFENRLKEIKTDLEAISAKKIDAITQSDIDQAKELLEDVRQIRKEGSLTSNKKANENSVQKSLAQINGMLSENTKLSFRRTEVYSSLKSLQDAFKNFDTSRPQSELAELTTELLKTKANFEDLDTTVKGKNFIQTIFERIQGTSAQLVAQYLSWMDIIRYARSMISTIVDLDTQLVDLRKTTTMNTSELNQFYNSSSNVAKQLGVTTSEIISQASAWSRLGYSGKEAATEMAQLSSKFASISPGMTTENSTDYLVSTMQAYGIEVDDVERKILDNVNRIGNTFATTNAEIGEMLTRSSAAMKAANNSLEETIALESAAVQITRNAETTGTAFRTISMRIRGYDEETEELSEDLQNISGDIADLTKVGGKGGISIFTDASRTEYKSTYEILKEIAGIWDDLTDKQQADLLEKLGGESFATRYRNIFYRTHLIARTA